MKKLILLFSVIALLATSCADKNAFTINGTLPNNDYNGHKVHLMALDSAWGRMPVAVDSVSVADGKFAFKGIAKDEATVHFITLENAKEPLNQPTLIAIEPGVIEVTLDTVSTVKGGAVNEAFQEYQKKGIAFSKEMRALYAEMQTKAEDAELKANFEKKYEEGIEGIKESLYTFVKPNIGNQVGAYFFIMEGSNLFSLEQKEELFAQIKPEYKEFERFKALGKNLAALTATAVGKQFVDIKGKTPEGNDAALSDYAGKGKIVLIDFWASWCGPCIAEMPNVKEAYAKYKDKGFEIVAISLDDNADAWKKSIKDLAITWPQISDLKAWESDLAAAYGVRSIPHTVLLDKDGKIIEKDLRGEKIAEKLSELLK